MRIPYKKALGQKVKPGRPSTGKRPEKKELLKLYIKEKKSIREIAENMGCSKDMVYRSLRENEILRRPDNKRSKLTKYEKSFLRIEVKKKGITKTAKELEVDTRTLKKFIQ